ncbi:alpha-1,3-mannosyl-glycoprotein 2-beta-N-acetylglucosaminyltransferase [Bradysia coprophila]|uniref:alpha-1,3-mannosyl-glycoprotein 2-beta-N-acetylglucosaminyltransferase n=1 Tax=Bradysia coprophila TaxID=38358 RepID=UPI00187DA2D3|nr:alpha-1,3-mannosyl-glycoprotein 2-beta-N-acetylglucosaminyltransferase [Bradysia coprophila]
MRSKKAVLIASFLCVWTIITYILFMRQTFEVDSKHKHMENKLNYLEAGIQEEAEQHDILLHQFVSVVKSRAEFQMTSSTTTSTQNAEKNDRERLNGVKEISLVDNSIPNPNRHNLSLIQKHGNGEFKGPVIPVLVFACNRVSVKNCLENLVDYRPNAEQFPIIVSQDCNDEPTRNVILSFKEVFLISQPDQTDILVPPKEKKFKGYYKISRHYGWALNTVFSEGFDYVIIVEDDLNVSPDFYEYFLGTHELLKNDSSLWCVSAWNDNGKVGNIDENASSLLYRSDFFPGLGWMLTKELWTELSVKWPKAFWDDWIRQPQQRKDRVCIRPEISRTRTFGKVGVSNGMFFEKHLKFIKLSEVFVPFTEMDLSYLLKQNYDKTFLSKVYSYPVVTFEELRRGNVVTKGEPVRIQYNTKDQYKRTAKLLGLMDDFKSGVPRTGYHGIISFFYNDQRVYLAPNSNWKGYDLSWS